MQLSKSSMSGKHAGKMTQFKTADVREEHGQLGYLCHVDIGYRLASVGDQ